MTHYHLIGIGGTGLSAIAHVLLERGNVVSGSDNLLSPLAQELIDLGISVSIGHNENNITGADIIIRSSAIPDNNSEVKAALAAGIPILKRRNFLSKLTAGSTVIAIAGTHGKTTTTAMVAWCLSSLGNDPSYVIGGSSKNLGNNAHAGRGKYFVIEADEYDRMFLGLTPEILVITNIEHDHPDCYPTAEEYLNAFFELTQKIKPNGTLIACADHPGIIQLLTKVGKQQKIIAYGTSSKCDYKIENLQHTPGRGVDFILKNTLPEKGSFTSRPIRLLIPGEHNAFNAAAALAVIDTIRLSTQSAITALEQFKGTGRRFDILGEVAGIILIDDYAHHPTEIQATISAARYRYPNKNIWTVWQPHTYSRTQQLFKDFTKSFSESDHVIVTDIYASREKDRSYSSKTIVANMDHPDVRFIAQLQDVTKFLVKHLSEGDVLLVLSAGDANKISQDVLNYFIEKGHV
ncbi:MAG: UDP-N-acetylmuramate--L-alanine ligase [Anaerolineaceae bacterium]|nr:UDP-N-acetylmuramate--L-alanine ligase [Anaerolineaceae bacterium]